MRTKIILLISLFNLLGVDLVNAQIPEWLPTKGLIAWFPFNNDFIEESGKYNDRTIYGGVKLTTDRNNKSNSACNFDGTGRIVYEDFPTELTAYTYSGWYRFNKTTNDYWNLFSQLGYSFLGEEENSYGVGVFNKEINIYHRIRRDLNITHSCTSIQLDVFWNFIVSTWDGDYIRIYYNGNKVDSVSCKTRYLMKSTFQLSNGRPVNNTFDLYKVNLDIDDVAIYDRALTDSEIAAIYKGDIAAIKPKSSENKLNWNVIPSGSTSALSSISFPSLLTGYVVGYNGAILKTTDAGNSWKALNGGTTSRLNSVYFTNESNGYAIAGGGDVLKTLNGGNTWEIKSSGESGLNSIFFTNATTGYAVGAFCAILKTIDGGATWKKYESETDYAALNSVHFPNSSIGFAVGGGGRIMRTTNAGVSWSKQIYQDNVFWAVYFINSNIGYVVGSNGIILKTTNSGQNWNKQLSGTTSTLWSVYFCDENNGYIVGNSGTLLSTKDGGNTWIKTIIGSNDLFSVFFNDNLTGYVVGGKGTIIMTSP
jgi:photosystem II stability/assembly factor-like uncharacterized protein